MALVPKQTSSYNIPASASISRTSISRYGKKQSEGLGNDGSQIVTGHCSCCTAHFRASLELAAFLEESILMGLVLKLPLLQEGNTLRELGGDKTASSPKEPHHLSQNESTFMCQAEKCPWLLVFLQRLFRL